MAIAGARRERIPNRPWQRVIQAICAVIKVLPAIDGSLFVAFCAVHPINPLCCPTPCPVSDSVKISDFLNEAEQAWQKVAQCSQIAGQYMSLVTTFGPNGRLADDLRRLPGSVSGAFRTFQATPPSLLTAGDLGNPRTVAEILKASLFEPAGSAANSLTDQVGRGGWRVATTADEAINALATGLHGYRRLSDVAGDRGQQTVAAAMATTLRGDFAANGAARQSLVDNLSGLKELLSTWVAAEATASSLAQTATLGTLPPSSALSPVAVSLQKEADQRNQLRQMRLAVNQLDVTTSALTALHNERHAAAVMLAQYPGLWNTLASDDKALQFRTADASAAAAALERIFTDGNAAFAIAQTKLRSLDTTNWKDNATKMQAAGAAAQSVVQDILANPRSYGALRSDPLSGPGGRPQDVQTLAELANHFSAWLEDDKLERFWAPLRQDADTALAGLDQRLKEMSAKRGFDLSGPAAAEQELTLLGRFDRQTQAYQQKILSGQDAITAAQKAALSAYVSAFQDAAGLVRSDRGASGFVSIRWPS